MTEEEQIVALFIAANPVPDPDLLEPVGPPHHLDHPSGWGDVVAYTQLERPGATGPARPRLVVPVAVAAVIAVGGLAVWLGHDPSDGPASSGEVAVSESDGPALLAPPADLAALVVTEAAHGQSDPGFVRGAVQTPSGEIIGITIIGGLYGGGIGGSQTIGGHTVAVGRGTREDFWSYGVSSGCWWAQATMSDGLETPTALPVPRPDVETFFRQLTITGTTMTVRLPPGWASLGAAATSDRYTLHFSATVDLGRLGYVTPDPELDAEVQLDQRPNTGVGVFLADPGRTNPRPTTLSGQPAWLMTDSEGWTTLVFDHDGTAVSLRARGLNNDELLDFAATLAPQPWDDTSALLTGTNPPQTPVDEQLPSGHEALPADCDVTLEIVETDLK